MTIQRYKGLINHVSFLLFFSFFCCDTSLILRQNALMPSESVARPSFSSFFLLSGRAAFMVRCVGAFWSRNVVMDHPTGIVYLLAEKIEPYKFDFLHFEPPKIEPCPNCLSAFRARGFLTIKEDVGKFSRKSLVRISPTCDSSLHCHQHLLGPTGNPYVPGCNQRSSACRSVR